MTYSETNRVWWSFFWRAAVVGLPAGAIMGFIVGFILGFFKQGETFIYLGGIAAYIVSIFVSIWAFHSAVNRHKLQRERAE